MNGGTFLLELVGMKIRRTLLFGIVLTRPLNFDFGPPTGDKHWPELVDDSFFPPGSLPLCLCNIILFNLENCLPAILYVCFILISYVEFWDKYQFWWREQFLHGYLVHEAFLYIKKKNANNVLCRN